MLFIILLIIFYVILIKQIPHHRVDNFICSAIMALLLEGCVLVITSLFVEHSVSSTEVIEKKEIVALQDGNESSGKFFLGLGKLSDEMHFTYYYETDFGITYDSISAENKHKPVYIRYLEKDSEISYILQYGIVKYTYFEKPNIPLWLSLSVLLRYGGYEDGDVINTSIDMVDNTDFTDLIADTDHDDVNDYRYEFWIPEGSILEGFELDLQ